MGDHTCLPRRDEYVCGCGRQSEPEKLGSMTGKEETLMPGVGPTGTRGQRRAPLVVLVLTGLAQGAVLFLTFVAGLQWDGWTYSAALLQAVLLGGVLLALVSRRSWLALAVPLISAAISLRLLLLFVEVEEDAACTSDMREATAQVEPLPGTNATFDGEVVNGCIARFTVPASKTDSVIPHYRREFARNGWEITAEESDELVATRDRIVMNVSVPEGEGGLVIVRVDHTSTGAG